MKSFKLQASNFREASNFKLQQRRARSLKFDACPALRDEVWSLMLGVCLFAGCSVGPNYHRPPLDVPSGFRGAPPQSGTNSLADLHWWAMFKDDTLQGLIRAALTNNYDARIAFARVEQARAVLQQNRAGFFPQLNYFGAVSRGKNASSGGPTFTEGTVASSFVTDANVAWELDLWGRIRRQTEAARAQFLASEEARRDVMVSLVSDVALNYFELLALDEQLAIAKRSTNAFGESWNIFSERLKGGIVSKLETSAAEAALASAAATVPDFERQILIKENQINVLLGRNPGPVPRNRSLLQEQLPPEVPAGLPSTLVERRPDIRVAEQNFRASNAQVGVAVANFFPQLNLTAFLGQVSPELSAFTAGGANAWSIGANLAGPIFHGGRLKGQYHQALAARDESRLRYQFTVLNAFEEVSDELVAREKFAEQRVQQQRAVQADQVAVQVAQERYVAGRAGYYELLQEQQLLFPAENALVQVQVNQYLAIVQLYRALGGGY
jgi:multidrug efflux system outer membrane protein